MSWKFNALTPNAYRIAGTGSLAILAGLFLKSCLTEPDYTLLTMLLIVGVPFGLAWLREHYVTRKFQLAIIGAKNYDARSRLLGTTEIAAVPKYVKNACRCGICGAAADRDYDTLICQSNPGHRGDTWTGIFSDLSWHGDAKQVTDAN